MRAGTDPKDTFGLLIRSIIIRRAHAQQVALKGTASVELCVHGELYECVLPSLVLPDPLSDHCIPDWKGKCRCIASTVSLRAAAVYQHPL